MRNCKKAENAELRRQVSVLEDAIDWDEADGYVATSYGRDTYSSSIIEEIATRRPDWKANGHGAVTKTRTPVAPHVTSRRGMVPKPTVSA